EWCAARTTWRAANEQHGEAVAAAKQIEARRAEREKEHEQAKQAQEAAEQRRATATPAATIASNHLEALKKRYEQLLSVEGESTTCLLCGQRLETGHIEMEIRGLEPQIAEAGDVVAKAQREKSAAEKAYTDARALVNRLEKQVADAIN